MPNSSKAVPTKTALTKTAPLKSAQKPAAGSQSCPASPREGEAGPRGAVQCGILEQLQDAMFIFTTDLRGIITGCNQAENNQREGRCAFMPADLVGRNVADFYAAGQQMVFPSQAIALVLARGNSREYFAAAQKPARILMFSSV